MDAVTLKQMRYADALARLGHFGLAAEACAVSQPALSAQIKTLEEHLGAALFDRGPRHVRLTGFGEAFIDRARDILRSVDDLKNLARAAQGPLTGQLKLGVIPTVAPYLLPRFMTALPQSHPGLDVRIRETITPRLLAELRQGQLDAVVVALPLTAPWIEALEIGEEQFVLVRAESQDGAPLPDTKALKDERLLLLEEGHCFRDQALDLCGLPRNAASGLDGSSLSTLVQMVGAGLGVTLIPEMAVDVETRRAPVSVSTLPGASPGRRLALAWRGASPLADQLREIGAVLKGSLMS